MLINIYGKLFYLLAPEFGGVRLSGKSQFPYGKFGKNLPFKNIVIFK
jgi:hypothetical protein